MTFVRRRLLREPGSLPGDRLGGGLLLLMGCAVVASALYILSIGPSKLMVSVLLAMGTQFICQGTAELLPAGWRRTAVLLRIVAFLIALGGVTFAVIGLSYGDRI